MLQRLLWVSVVVSVVYASVSASRDACWKGSGTRQPKVVDSCPSDQDKDGGLCYPRQDGYRHRPNVGLNVLRAIRSYVVINLF